jgi:hypothetical protein
MNEEERSDFILSQISEFQRQFEADRKSGHLFFKKLWSSLTLEEKKGVVMDFKMYLVPVLDRSYGPDIRENRYCARLILDYIKEDLAGNVKFEKINLKMGIKPVDIVAAHKILHDLDYFENDLADYGHSIRESYRLKTVKSIGNYLKNRDKLRVATKKYMKKLIDNPYYYRILQEVLQEK